MNPDVADDPLDSEATMEVTGKSGRVYDIKNMPGLLRKKLIDEGELGIDTFVSPGNMPGKKLKELRDKFKASIGFGKESDPEGALPPNIELEVGMQVSHKGFNTIIVEVVDEEKVKIRTPENKKRLVKIRDLRLPIESLGNNEDVGDD